MVGDCLRICANKKNYSDDKVRRARCLSSI